MKEDIWENSWHSRAPLSLLRPHQDAVKALLALTNAAEFLRQYPSPVRKKWPDIRRAFADQLVRLDDTAWELFDSLILAKEEFAAVADSLVEWPSPDPGDDWNWPHTRVAVSWHSAVHQVISEAAHQIVIAGGTDPDIRQFPIRLSFDVDAIESFLTRDLQVFRPITVIMDGVDIWKVKCLLERELFLAWKRMYPSNDAKYDNSLIGEMSPERKEEVKETERQVQAMAGRRRAFGRDQQFLKWNDEGLKAAGIRDKWNDMSDDQRKSICPQCWAKIEVANVTDNGRDTVEKAIIRARKGRYLLTKLE